MSRAIPAPTKAKKKAPPPPRPFQNLPVSQTVPFDEPEQERPEKLSPSPQTNTQSQQEATQYIGSASSPLQIESSLVTANITEATREVQTPPIMNRSEKEGSEEPPENLNLANNQFESLSNEMKVERTAVQSAGSSFQTQAQEYKPTPNANRKAPLPPTAKGKPIKRAPPPPSRAFPTSNVAPIQTIQEKNPDEKPINQEHVRPEPPIQIKTQVKTTSQQAQIPPATGKKQQQETVLIQTKSNPPTLSQTKPATEKKAVPPAPKPSKQEQFRQSSPTKQSSVAQEGTSGKSSMAAKLDELRKAKERMLKEQPSDIDENDEEEEEQQNQADFVKQKEQQEPKETPLELTTTTFSVKAKQETTQAEASDVPVKNAPSPPSRIPPRTAPINKKVAPPPTKNIPKPQQLNQDNPAPEKQQSQKTEEAPQIIEVKEKEEYKSQQREEKPIQVAKPKIIVNTKTAKDDNQIDKLLERYHTLKTGYLNNLRQLDELLHFQKQQEDSQIEKINHLLAELHRRNTTLKQICSTQELPPADEQLPV